MPKPSDVDVFALHPRPWGVAGDNLDLHDAKGQPIPDWAQRLALVQLANGDREKADA